MSTDIKMLLAECESFMSGFEDDDTQEEPIDELLERLRAAIAAPLPTLGIVISGGTLQAVISDDPGTATSLLNGVVLIDYDIDGDGDEGIFKIAQSDGNIYGAVVLDQGIEQPLIDFAGLLRAVDEANGQPS